MTRRPASRTHNATSCVSATDVSEVNIVNKALGTFSVIDANNAAAALTQQAGLPGNPVVTSEKLAAAAKSPKDPASILHRVASEKAAIKLLLQLRALGQAVEYTQADTGPWLVRIRRVGFPAQTEILSPAASLGNGPAAGLRACIFHPWVCETRASGDGIKEARSTVLVISSVVAKLEWNAHSPKNHGARELSGLIITAAALARNSLGLKPVCLRKNRQKYVSSENPKT